MSTFAGSCARFYFYTASGEEMSDHPMNGCRAGGMSAYVSDAAGRETVRGMPMRDNVGTYEGNRLAAPVTLTAEDFGGAAVIVKFWTATGQGAEMFWLYAPRA